MNIAIDIDDTLTESFEYFQPYVAEYFNADIDELRRKNISYSNLPDEWKAHEIDFCKTYYDRIVEDTPFKTNAAPSIKKLKEMVHRIIIITRRTTAFYTDPYKTTAAELKKGNIIYDKLICTLDKGKACTEEKIDILIDDLPSNCDAASKLGIKTVMFTSNANADTKTNHIRVSDWKSVVDLINTKQ